MKIVHICLCGCVTDGWSYQDNLLPKYQRRNGHEVTVIASRWIWNESGQVVEETRPDHMDYQNEDDVHMIRLRSFCHAGIQTKWKCYPGLIRTVEAEQPDILFIHGLSFLQIWSLTGYLRRHPQVRGYCDNHGDYSNSATNWVSKNLLHKCLWRAGAHHIAPYVRKFWGVLPARVDFMVELYRLPAQQCDLLVMGADNDRVEKAREPERIRGFRERYGIKSEDTLIVTGGKIDRYKRQMLDLPAAIRKLGNNNIKLLVFGSVDPELRDTLLKECDGTQCIYAGWFNTDETYDALAAAQIAIFPGRHSVLWEQAVGQGIPLIVKHWEGTEHVNVNGNALFLDQDGCEDVVCQIKKMLREYEKYRQLADKASAGFQYGSIARRAIEE